MSDLEVPEGMGVIVRTAGSERSKAEIKRDFEYLLRLWDEIRELTLKSTAPALIYEEGNLIKRSIRDLYARDIDEVHGRGRGRLRDRQGLHEDADAEPRQAREALSRSDACRCSTATRSRARSTRSTRRWCSCARAATSSSTRPRRWSRSTSIPAARRASATSRRRRSRPIVEAADEIARQLRLRDLAGLIVIDFIDMEEHRNQRHGRAPAQGGDAARPRAHPARPHQPVRPPGDCRASACGPSLVEASTQPCPHCNGTGHIRSIESTALHVLRAIEEEGMRRRSAEIAVDGADRRSRSTSSTRSARPCSRSKRASASMSRSAATRRWCRRPSASSACAR